MKKLKMLVMAMTAVLMSVSFIACNLDDNSTEDLKGRWFTTTESLSELLIINDDNSVVTYRASNYDHGLMSKVLLQQMATS